MSWCCAALPWFWCFWHVHGFVPQGWHLNWVPVCLKNSCASQSTSSLTYDQLSAACGGGFYSQPVSTAVLSGLLLFPQVQYAARGFLEKNRDTLPANIRGLFINSVTPLLSVLFTGKSLCTSTMSQGPPWQGWSVGMRLMCFTAGSSGETLGILQPGVGLLAHTEVSVLLIPCHGMQGMLYPLPES